MPDLVKVKIRGTVITMQYGALKTDDILVCTSDYAKHLVEDCGAAEYHGASQQASKPATETKNTVGKSKKST